MKRDLLTAVSLWWHQLHMEITKVFYTSQNFALGMNMNWTILFGAKWTWMNAIQSDTTGCDPETHSCYLCLQTELMKHINHKLFLILCSFFLLQRERRVLELATKSGHLSWPPNFVLLLLHLCHFDFINWLLPGLSLQEKNALLTKEEILNTHQAACYAAIFIENRICWSLRESSSGSSWISGTQV